MANKIKLQNVANLSALGAIEAYTSAPGTLQSPKVAAALAGANRVLGINGVKLLSGSDENFQLGASNSDNGNLDPALYIPTLASASAPMKLKCGGTENDYPCLVQHVATVAETNSIYLTLQNRQPFVTPFSSWYTSGGIVAHVESLATRRPRCVQFALDMSPSIGSQNLPTALHTMPPSEDLCPSWPCTTESCLRSCKVRYTEPSPAPVFRGSRVEIAPDTLPDWNWCRNLNADQGTLEQRKYCSIISYGTGPIEDAHINRVENPASPVFDDQGKFLFYGSDWRQVPIKTADGIENYYVFSVTAKNLPNTTPFIGPEPLTSLMTAVNAVLVDLRSQATSADRVGMFVFDEAIRGRVPLSTDFHPLLQLTNPRNMGLTDITATGWATDPEVHPNLADLRWFPMTTSFTNLIAAFDTMIDDLTNPLLCPPEAQKIAVIATDGRVNVSFNSSGQAQPNRRYQSFVAARQQLIAPQPGQPNIMNRIRSNKIQLVVLQFGEGVGMRKLENPDAPDESAYVLMFPEDFQRELRTHYEWGTGNVLTSISTDPDNENMPAFVSDTSDGNTPPLGFDVNEQTAWENGNFAAPSFFLYDLAQLGTYCPLTLAGSNCVYRADVSGRMRLVGSETPMNARETCPLYSESAQQRAALCIRKFIENIPFELRRVPPVTHRRDY